MRAEDKRSKNLISRLFSYSGRPDRKPIEDYCTEALAWCLTESPSLLTAILPEAKDWFGGEAPILQVDTQVTYDARSLEDDSNEMVDRGRFDLVISGGANDRAVVVIESKVGSNFGPRQVERYRAELCRPDSFPEVAAERRYLVTLTVLRQSSDLLHASIMWPQVHRAICEKRAEQTPHTAAVFLDFADFLKEKGLSMLQMIKIDHRLMTGWFEVKELEEQLTHIIERLRISDAVKSTVGRRQTRSDGNEWLGVCGTSDFYAGFGFLRGESQAKLVIWVEITLAGDQRNLIKRFDSDLKGAFEEGRLHLKRLDGEEALNFDVLVKGNSRFVFVVPIDERLNGDGEETFKALYNLSKKVIALAKAES